MFTGIIEAMAIVSAVEQEGSNMHFIIESPIARELKIDQSVAHNGVCLTVVERGENRYAVTAISETLAKTNLGQLKTGNLVNLERALIAGSRLDGHFVQGHVDTTGVCTARMELNGSWLFRFRFPKEFGALVIEKGSICINGVSLTVFDIGVDECSVAIIPYTFGHTNFQEIEVGSIVNFEFDVLGKYLLRMEALKQQ